MEVKKRGEGRPVALQQGPDGIDDEFFKEIQHQGGRQPDEQFPEPGGGR